MAPKYGNGMVHNFQKQCSLWVNFENTYEWHIRICRIDKQEDDKLLSLNMKEVTPEKISEFVPNWEKLHWKSGDIGNCRAEFIQDEDFKFYLVLFENASISPDKAIEQFKCFMSG